MEKKSQPSENQLNIGGTPQGPEVPTFGCVVYVLSMPEGDVRARVANLAGIECRDSNERAALSQLVPAFKRRVTELLENGAEIEWIDPPNPPETGEQNRFIPVHL